MPSPFVLFALAILLLPMLYLLIASPAFLLVTLQVPQVGRLLRTMFFGYFNAVIATGTVATLTVLVGGHWLLAPVIALVPGLAVPWRRWLLGRMDGLLLANAAGEVRAPGDLRRLHWLGMLANAAALAAIIAIVPRLATPG